MRSLSVTTISFTSSLRAWPRTSKIRPLWSGVIHKPAAPAEEVAVSHGGGAHRRGVDDRQQLFDMAGKHLIEQSLVPVHQTGHRHVLLERIVPPVLEMLVGTQYLMGMLRRLIRQHSVQLEQLSLLLGERSALVQKRIGENARTALPHIRHDPLAVIRALDAVLHTILRCRDARSVLNG